MSNLPTKWSVWGLSLVMPMISAQAQNSLVSDPQSLSGARSAGRAGSSVASQLYSDSLFQNPASAAFQSRYSLSLGYLAAGEGLLASIVDTKSGPVGGGVYYLRRRIAENQIQENAGFSLLHRPADRLGIGTTIRYVYQRQASSERPAGALWNFDVGLRFLISPSFALGLVGQNLLESNTGSEARHYSAGAEYLLTPQIALSVQARQIASVEKPELNYSAGAEYRFTNGVTLRTGYEDKRFWNERWAAAGLGYEQQEFGLDYAASKRIGSAAGSWQHTLGLSAFF